MSYHRYLKYFGAAAIAIYLQSEIFASPLVFKERLSSPWESAVLTHTLSFPTRVNTIQFSPDGKILAGIGANQIALWRVDNAEIEGILPNYYATKLGLKIAPTAIAFSPDSRFLATATWSQGLLTPDYSIVVWEIATGEKVLSLQDSSGCRQVLFDVEGEIIYGACDFGVTAWSVPEGKKLFSFDGDYPVEKIALHPQKKLVATVDANTTGKRKGKSNQIQLWQIDRDKSTLLKTLDGHVNDIARLEFTADGKRLVSSSYDGKIKVWNWQQGTIYPKTNSLYSNDGWFSLSADSRLIAGNFKQSAIASLITGLPLINVKTTGRGNNAIAFSPQERIYVTVEQSPQSDRSLIHLWQVDASQPKTSMRILVFSHSLNPQIPNSPSPQGSEFLLTLTTYRSLM